MNTLEKVKHNKPFDKELFDMYDKKGKEYVINTMKEVGLEVVENTNEYGVDLVAYRDGKKWCYMEVEVRVKWEKGLFPYEKAHLKKDKVGYKDLDLPCVLIMTNVNYTNAIMIGMSQIDTSEDKEKMVPTDAHPQSEPFFYIPKDLFVYFGRVK